MGKYSNSGLFNGTKGNKQTSIEQNEYIQISNYTSYSSSVNVDKQNKHIKGNKEYIDGKSEITISIGKCMELINKFSKKGQIISNNKERVDFGEIIGNYIDGNGNSQPTTIGIIHKSKTGCHIVPAKPKGGQNDNN